MHLVDCKIYIQYDKRTDSVGDHYVFNQFIFTDEFVTQSELRQKIRYDHQRTQLDFFDWGHVAPAFQKNLAEKRIVFAEADVHQLFFESTEKKRFIRNIVHQKNQSVLTAINETYPNVQKILMILHLKRYVVHPED